jgi:hypothetical protein
MAGKEEQAFPFQVKTGDGAHYIHPGMSLRDYFAASALTGLIAHVPADRVAALSYKAADDMLSERMKEARHD